MIAGLHPHKDTRPDPPSPLLYEQRDPPKLYRPEGSPMNKQTREKKKRYSKVFDVIYGANVAHKGRNLTEISNQAAYSVSDIDILVLMNMDT